MLPERAEAVARATGLPEATAAWAAFAALHAGVFTPEQCTAWFGEPGEPASPAARQACSRTIRALAESRLGSDLELPGHGRVLHIRHRSIYRALGDPENRNRRAPGQAKTIERLLGLDYVLEHREEGWLPTEPDKTSACESHRIARDAWPHKVYEGAGEPTTRYFVEKWPLAISAGQAVACVVSPGTTLARLRSWQQAYGPFIRALGAAGLQVRLVHISHREGLAGKAQRDLDAMVAKLGQGDPDAAEIERIKAAILTGTTEAAAPWGGWGRMLAKAREIYRRGAPGGPPPVQAEATAWTSERIRPPGGAAA